VCAEAALATNADIGAAAYEETSQRFLTSYILSMSPHGAGWAEWQALLLQGVADLYEATADLSLFSSHSVLLQAYLERELFLPLSSIVTSNLPNSSSSSQAELLWRCDGGVWNCKNPEVDWPSGQRDGFVFTPTNSVVNSHYVGALLAFARLAASAGDSQGAATATANATALALSMAVHLFDAVRGVFVDGLETTHASIHSTVYALANGVTDLLPVVDAGVAEKAWATLVGRLNNSTSGIPVGPYPGMFYGLALFKNTSDHGREAVGRFLLNNGTNSWLNQIRQGATTTMEAWTPSEKPNLTWSHPWMAFPLLLITRWLLGVRALVAGYNSILIQPQLGPLSAVQGVVPTLRGPVAVSVTQVLDSRVLPISFSLNVTIPGGVQSKCCLPLPACGERAQVTVDGSVVTGAVEGDYACVKLSEGVHQLSCA